jgi:hypothetical protein
MLTIFQKDKYSTHEIFHEKYDLIKIVYEHTSPDNFLVIGAKQTYYCTFNPAEKNLIVTTFPLVSILEENEFIIDANYIMGTTILGAITN